MIHMWLSKFSGMVSSIIICHRLLTVTNTLHKPRPSPPPLRYPLPYHHPRTSPLTYNEQHLDDYVGDDAGSPTARVISREEGGVVRYDDGYVEGTQEDQPIPADLEDAVVQQYETRTFHLLHFIFGQGGGARQVVQLRGGVM